MSGITYKEAKSVIIANKVKQLFIHGEYDYHHDFTDEECEEVFKEAEAICEQEDAFSKASAELKELKKTDTYKRVQHYYISDGC